MRGSESAQREAAPPPQPAPVENTNSKQIAAGLVKKGNQLFMQQQYEEAARAYLEAIQRNPRLPMAYRGLGSAMAASGRTAEAVAYYKKYLALSPSAPDAPQVQKIISDYYRAGGK
jgi:tetratricopeptide (TPR) repeat protein